MIFLVLFLSMFLQNPVLAGQNVGSGGDAIRCLPSTDNQFKGLYSLDYLVQFSPQYKVVSQVTIEASLTRLENLFKEKLPEFLSSFKEFRATLFNQDPSKLRIWETSTFGLVDLKDEELATLLPENCQKPDGSAEVVQAVIRQPPEVTGGTSNTIVYKFVPEVVEDLKKSAATQLSFLLIHEWLWDFSDNVDRNRRLNYLLHTDKLEKQDRQWWLETMYNLGFSSPFIPQLDSFYYVVSCRAICGSSNDPNSKDVSAVGISKNLWEYGRQTSMIEQQCKWLGKPLLSNPLCEEKEFVGMHEPNCYEGSTGFASNCRAWVWGYGLGKNGDVVSELFYSDFRFLLQLFNISV